MRRKSLGVFFLFLLPVVTQAQCLGSGYTVVFVNGIFNSRDQAESNRKALEVLIGKSYRGEQLNVHLGYNESHLAGAGDLLQAATQAFNGSITNYDRDTILLQIHPEVTTRKLLLVGHSQGTFYTNNMYGYLLDHGEPKENVGVYNVATPANYVAGGGAYLTSSLDSVINLSASVAKDFNALPPLPANINLWTRGPSGNGHSFSDVYLAEAGDRVVGDIQTALGKLKATQGTAIEGCFTPPEQGLGYQTQKAILAVADPASVAAVQGAKLAYQGAALAANATMAAVGSVASAIGSLNPFAKAEPRTENLPGSFTVVKTLYGSSLNEGDLKELLGTSQGGAVAAATQPLAPKVAGEVKGTEAIKPTPAQPVVPFPTVPALPSPGYGGGSAPKSSETTIAISPGSTPKTLLVIYTFVVSDVHLAATVCAFDSDAPAPCSNTFSKELGEGAHTFTLTATDSVGNTTTETRTFSVTP